MVISTAAVEAINDFYETAYQKGYQDALKNKELPVGTSYRQAYENGVRDQNFDNGRYYDDDDLERAKQEGIEEAWATAKFALLMVSNEEMCRVFKVNKWQMLFNELTGTEAVDRLKERAKTQRWRISD